MQNHSYDLHQPTDSFHDNQTVHFYMKGFTQRLVLKQRHKDTFIHELLTRAFDFLQKLWNLILVVILRKLNTEPQHFVYMNAIAFKCIFSPYDQKSVL